MKRAVLWIALAASGLAGDADIARWVAEQGGRTVADSLGRIVEIDLTGAWIGDADLDRIAGLRDLRKLTLAETKITDAGFDRLKLLPNVRELDCYFCEYVTEDGILSLKGWKRLERLNLRGTKVTSRVFESLAEITSLRDLDLAHTQIEDDGLDQLTSLVKLERLAIGGNRLDGRSLTALRSLAALRSLDVGGIQRVDSGLWGLALTETNLDRIARLTQLTSLSLSGANLADRGLDRPGHPEAERTELRDLVVLRALSNLERLDLSRTPVLPEALEQIAALPKLREVRLGLTSKINEAALERFRQLRPDCVVVR